MPYHIFGKVQNHRITSIGCVRDVEIPSDSILLQTVEHHPELNSVKWAMRFRRTLTDKTLLGHPLAKYFTNPSRLKRVLGEEDFKRLSGNENLQFLKFHKRNPSLLTKFIQAALAEQSAGRKVFSAGELIGDTRWGDTDIDRGGDQFKINDRWVPWYSRVAQMLERRLLGFFRVRTSMADGLVWNGRTWQQFALEHDEQIDWSESSNEIPDLDWEYLE